MRNLSVRVRCRDEWHRIRYQDRRLKFDGHGSGRELNAAIVGCEFGDKLEGCTKVLWAWREHKPEHLPADLRAVWRAGDGICPLAKEAAYRAGRFGLKYQLSQERLDMVDRAESADECAAQFVDAVRIEMMVRGYQPNGTQSGKDFLTYGDAEGNTPYETSDWVQMFRLTDNSDKDRHPRFRIVRHGGQMPPMVESLTVSRRVGAVGGNARKTVAFAANCIHAAVVHGRLQQHARSKPKDQLADELRRMKRLGATAAEVDLVSRSLGYLHEHTFSVGGKDFTMYGQGAGFLAIRAIAELQDKLNGLSAASWKLYQRRSRSEQDES